MNPNGRIDVVNGIVTAIVTDIPFDDSFWKLSYLYVQPTTTTTTTVEETTTTTTTTTVEETTTTTTTEEQTTTTTTTLPARSGYDTAPLTFVTSKQPGETIQSDNIATNTGYYKVTYWDGTSETKNNGEFTKVIPEPDNADPVIRTISIEPCDVDGNLADGNITIIGIRFAGITSIDTSGLNGLDVLNLSSNPIQAIDLVGMTSLHQLYLRDVELSSIDLLGCINLNLVDLQWTTLSSEGQDLLLNSLDSSFDTTNPYQFRPLTSNLDNRTSASDVAYNNLASKYWTIINSASADTAPLTFVTSQVPGQDIQFSIEYSSLSDIDGNSYLKVEYWDGTSEIITGNGFNTITKTIDAEDNYQTRTITVYCCDSHGNLVASTIYGLGLSPLSSLDFSGLKGLTSINITGIDSTGQIISNLSSIDLTGQSRIWSLGLSWCNISSIDISDMPKLNNLHINGNPISPENTDDILNILVNNPLNNDHGNTPYLTIGSNRTSASDSDYNTLISRGWSITELAYPDSDPLIFVTEFGPGETITGTIAVEPLGFNNYYKVTYWDGTSAVYSNYAQFSKTIDENDTNDVRSVSIEACGSDGVSKMGPKNIVSVMLRGSGITQIDTSGLNNLGTLDLIGNKLSSISLANKKLSNLQLGDNYLTTLNTSGLKELSTLNVTGNLLSTVSFVSPTKLTSIDLSNNPLTPEGTDELLISLATFATENSGGLAAPLDRRTSASDSAYNTIDNTKSWSIISTGLLDLGPLTFITSKGPGETISGEIASQYTGYYKVTYWDGTSEVVESSYYPSGSPYYNGHSFSKTIDVNDTYEVRNVTIEACNPTGNTDSGRNASFQSIFLDNCEITSIDLSNSIPSYLYLNDNNLESIDLTGQFYLQKLVLTNNPLTSSTQDSLLSQLYNNHVDGGILEAPLADRTSASDAEYDTLVNTRNWTITNTSPAILTYRVSQNFFAGTGTGYENPSNYTWEVISNNVNNLGQIGSLYSEFFSDEDPDKNYLHLEITFNKVSGDYTVNLYFNGGLVSTISPEILPA